MDKIPVNQRLVAKFYFRKSFITFEKKFSDNCYRDTKFKILWGRSYRLLQEQIKTNIEQSLYNETCND